MLKVAGIEYGYITVLWHSSFVINIIVFVTLSPNTHVSFLFGNADVGFCFFKVILMIMPTLLATTAFQMDFLFLLVCIVKQSSFPSLFVDITMKCSYDFQYVVVPRGTCTSPMPEANCLLSVSQYWLPLLKQFHCCL